MARIPVVILAALILSLPAGDGAARAQQDQSMTKKFPVGKGGELRVTISEGSIRVAGSDRDEVVVRVTGLGEDEEEQVHIGAHGNTVSVESAASGGDGGGLRFDISVPSRFDADLRTADGDITIDGPLTGEIRGTTGGGDIRLGDLGGTIDLSTSGGSIGAGDIKGDATLRTSGGDVRAGSVSGTADLSTSGGDIAIRDVGMRLSAATAGGNVSVGNVRGTAVISTSGGDVVAGTVAGNATLSTAGGNIQLRGADGSVKASTAGGDLMLNGIGGSVDGSTAGGNIRAELAGSPTGTSRLTSALGEIILSVPEQARVTINARIRVEGWWRSESTAYQIIADYPLTNYERDDQAREIRASVILNGGGKSVNLSTVNSNITIRKPGTHE